MMLGHLQEMKAPLLNLERAVERNPSIQKGGYTTAASKEQANANEMPQQQETPAMEIHTQAEMEAMRQRVAQKLQRLWEPQQQEPPKQVPPSMESPSMESPATSTPLYNRQRSLAATTAPPSLTSISDATPPAFSLRKEQQCQSTRHSKKFQRGSSTGSQMAIKN